ncbi:MAG: GGDEF domain-containing protein [Pseudolabrys sp.]|nr:GGDEF domain-containing protein [Pseudolabrys sp.]
MIETQTEIEPVHAFACAPRMDSVEATPVAVTRWSARLTDPQCEHDYRLDRFAADKRRALLLMGLVAVANSLIFAVEFQAYSHGLVRFNALIPLFTAIWAPLIGGVILTRIRSPLMLEGAMVLFVAIGMITRLGVLTLHSDMMDMWLTMMVGVLFVIYLYVPIRLTASLGLAVAFSCVAPFWWLQVQGAVLPVDQFYRGLIWLLLANALGYTAANSLHRSQRMQYAQSLVLRQLLSTDAMTGIANRRRFDAALEREWRRCQRAGVPLSLLMIDVDHFKAYNDHCGHPQGDACLRQVAQLLVDAVGRPGDLVARYGGEEFVCLLPNVGGAGALAVANKLLATLRHADIVHPRSPAGPRLTISIGVATAKSLTGRPERLVEVADQLLYAAKAAGRNQVKVGRLTAGTGTVANAA